MKIKYFGFLLLFLIFTAFSTVNKGFYEILSSENISEIDRKILDLKELKNASQRNAYLGALEMKAAGFRKSPAEKLKEFKHGHQLLENEIKQFPTNSEYRFLRLIIQEKAPKVLKYNSNLSEDKNNIKANFKNLDPDLQLIIKKYCLTSKILILNEL